MIQKKGAKNAPFSINSDHELIFDGENDGIMDRLKDQVN